MGNTLFNISGSWSNTRVVFSENENGDITQTSDYYPFGLQHESNYGTEILSNADQKYLYNGKELQDNTEWLDYGARMYDAALGRWHVMDGHAESYYDFSPYTYTFNNPINYIDLFGLDPVYRDGAYYDSETGKEMKWRKVERWLNKNDAVSERLTINDEEFKYENFETGESFSISKSNFTGSAAKLNNALVSGAKVENQYAAKEKAVKDAHKEGINLAKFVGFIYDPYAGVWKYDDGPEYVVDLNDFGIKNTPNLGVECQIDITKHEQSTGCSFQNYTHFSLAII